MKTKDLNKPVAARATTFDETVIGEFGNMLARLQDSAMRAEMMLTLFLRVSDQMSYSVALPLLVRSGIPATTVQNLWCIAQCDCGHWVEWLANTYTAAEMAERIRTKKGQQSIPLP